MTKLIFATKTELTLRATVFDFGGRDQGLVLTRADDGAITLRTYDGSAHQHPLTPEEVEKIVEFFKPRTEVPRPEK